MTRKTKRDLHLEDIDDEPTIDDLRVIVRYIDELWRLGDERVVADARHALLVIARRAAQRLVKLHKADCPGSD